MAGVDLTGVAGIGEATAAALRAAGIADAAALGAVDPENLPELEDFSGTLDWQAWIDGAKALAPAEPVTVPPAARKPRVNATVGKKKAKAEPTPVTPAASKPAAASTGAERRAFAIEWSVRVGGTTFTPTGDRPKLTEKEHAQLLASGAVTTPWLKGLKD